MKPRFHNPYGRKRIYPIDEIAYGESFFIPCERIQAHNKQMSAHYETLKSKVTDYKIKTKTVEGGIIVTKIKKEATNVV